MYLTKKESKHIINSLEAGMIRNKKSNRQVALMLEISPSYLNEVINRKKVPSVDVLKSVSILLVRESSNASVF